MSTFLLNSNLVKFGIMRHVTYLFPFIDVVSINKTAENFRLLYDVKGRFTVHRITKEEAKVY